VKTYHFVHCKTAEKCFVLYEYRIRNLLFFVIFKSGFDSGNGAAYYALPGSMTPSVLQLTQSSNVGLKGRWMFRVDGLNILLPNYPTASVSGIQVLQPSGIQYHTSTTKYSAWL